MASFDSCDRCGKTDEVGKMDLAVVTVKSRVHAGERLVLRLDLCTKCESTLYNGMNKSLKPVSWFTRLKKSLRKTNGER
jgi:hypothetical protein